jgi:hypothetical protein
MPTYKVKAKNFVQTIAANVDNEKLSDIEFRQFIRNSLPIVEGACNRDRKEIMQETGYTRTAQ